MAVLDSVKIRFRQTVTFCRKYPELSIIWFLTLAAIACNAATLLRKYDYWSRMYSFGLILLMWLVDGWIYHALSKEWKKSPMRHDFKEFLSTPILAMAIIFCFGAVLGFLYFLYFALIFRNCDKIIRLYSPEQFVADGLYMLTIMLTFPTVLVYLIQRSRIHLTNTKLTMIRRHLLFSMLILLFVKFGVEESYHTFEEVCRRREKLDKSCPIEHHYTCNTSETSKDITESQKHWLEIDESIIRPSIFLIIAELLPLFYAFHWEITRELEETEPHADEEEETTSLNEPVTAINGHNGETSAHGSDHHPTGKDSTDAALLLSSTRVTICVVMAILCAPMIFFRIGFRLNWIGYYPDIWAVETDRIGRIISSAALLLMYFAAFLAFCHPLREFKDHHLIHHSYLDRRLLVIAAAFSTVLYAVRLFSYYIHGVYKNDGHLRYVSAGLEINGELLHVASIWMQVVVLRYFLCFNGELLRIFKKKIFIFIICAICFNFFEWISVFMRRRFMEYILGLEETPYGVVITSAVTEPFYPAIGFYFFHSVMCWTVVAVRMIRMGMFSLGVPLRRNSQ